MGPVKNLIWIGDWRRNLIVRLCMWIKWGVFKEIKVVNVCLWWRRINGMEHGSWGGYKEHSLWRSAAVCQCYRLFVTAGETLQYKGNRKGKVVQFQNLRLDTDCKRYGAEQTKPGIQFGGNQREGLKIETIHGEERIQHFIVPVLVWINRKRGQSTFLFWSILSHWFLCTFNTVPVLRSLPVLSGPCDTNYSVEIFRWGNWGHLY